MREFRLFKCKNVDSDSIRWQSKGTSRAWQAVSAAVVSLPVLMTESSGKSSTNGQLLQVRDLKKYFEIRKGIFSRVVGHVKAVDGVSFHIGQGETLGLAGESGCGKTTTGRVILRLLEATEGDVRYKDSPNLLGLSQREMRAYRQEMQIIFQDPYSSLNPRLTIGSTLEEPLKVFGLGETKAARMARAAELLEIVGLSKSHLSRYPHEFSGGQRQRIGIARALSVEPSLIIADEPVSALDVSIQAQIINLLMDLREKMGLSYLFVAHDLSVVRHISDRMAIMYLGKIVELSNKHSIYNKPLHPYTQALLQAVPIPDPKKRTERALLEGDVPSPVNPPKGCRFHPRCPLRFELCDQKEPELVDHDGHQVACHLYPAGKPPEQVLIEGIQPQSK